MEKALGSQFGCGYIDEINTADTDFVQESTMRCDYWMCTMNPDDPTLPIYEQYINRFRALPEYEQDTPQEIQEELDKQPAQPEWTYWFLISTITQDYQRIKTANYQHSSPWD